MGRLCAPSAHSDKYACLLFHVIYVANQHTLDPYFRCPTMSTLPQRVLPSPNPRICNPSIAADKRFFTAV